MRLNDAHLRQVYLKPGEFYVGDVASRVTTILGSCVSVTLHHPGSGIGAICHAVMPENRERSHASRRGVQDPKYVDAAIRCLLDKMTRLGILPDELEVKLFGGATMITSDRRGMREDSVGTQNIAMAEQVLKTEGLTVAASDVGGARGRKIVFFTHRGVVLLKRLSAN